MNFCINSYIFLGIILCFLCVFEVNENILLLYIYSGYFYFYFNSLIFLIYFSMNISSEDTEINQAKIEF